MKPNLLAIVTVLLSVSATAQNQLLTTKTPEKPPLSVRAENMYNTNNASDADVVWMREIYRVIDLDKEKNRPLYYPEEKSQNEENMFRIILRLLCDNTIPAYDYLDGREVFTDQYKLNVKDMLERFHILYQEKPSRSVKNKQYAVEDSDVPCNEVLSYYMKERWVFDQRKSEFYPEIIAVCPVLHRTGDFGGEPLKYPMFWVKYESIKPYLAQQYILTSNENHIRNHSIDDYLKMRLFEGEIYKSTNLQNKSLMQLYPNKEEMQKAQQVIEDQLKNFDKNLWVKQTEIAKTTEKTDENTETSVKKEATKSKSSVRSSRGTSSSRTKASKPKSPRTKSASAPARSVRKTK